MTRAAALYRYLDASWIFAMTVLTALAIDDLKRLGAINRWRVAAASVMLLCVVLLAIALVYRVMPGGRIAMLAGVAQLVTIALFALAIWGGLKHRAALVAGAVVIEAVVLFAAPLLHYPYDASPELGGVRFLQRHLGLQRFVTMGPIAANYGSYYGIAQVNHNDLPVPQDWVDHIAHRVDRRADPIVFNPSSLAMLRASLPAYAELGTRYVVLPIAQSLPGLREVYRDRLMRIVEVPGTRPYVEASGCNVSVVSRTNMIVDCKKESRLIRRELYMLGWRATVDTKEVHVARTSGIFQSIPLSAGQSNIHFAYAPPRIAYGYILTLTGVLLLIGGAAMMRTQGREGGRRDRNWAEDRGSATVLQ